MVYKIPPFAKGEFYFPLLCGERTKVRGKRNFRGRIPLNILKVIERLKLKR